MLFDISKAATKLGFEPEYTLEKGLEDMAELSRFKEK
jgi:nucleoside-diphosphate-sugar epimerase